MADRRLGASRRFDEIASAHLVVGGGDDGQQAETDRVGEGGERLGEDLGLILVEAVAANGRAALNRIQ